MTPTHTLLLLALPGLVGLLLLFVKSAKAARGVSLVTSLAVLAVAGLMWCGFTPQSGFQGVVDYPWIDPFGIRFYLGVDGVSLPLIMLAALAGPMAVVASWKQEKPSYFGALLLLLAGMLGSLVALDLFTFYVFWEVMLVPAFFLVGLWGGAKRIGATLRFVIYTMAGSLAMFVAILVVAIQHQQETGVWSFAIHDLLGQSFGVGAPWLFGAFLIAFAIKAPLFPFHSWLPDAYTQAPTPITFLFSAVMAKLGVYGILRFVLPLFPNEAVRFAPVLMTLAVVGALYGALLALVQTDMKRLLAYSSMSHLGIILVGVFALQSQAAVGSIFQMVSHGVAVGALFLMVGYLAERAGTTEIEKFGGLAKGLPVMATLFMVAMLASVALPGTNSFVGEFLILLGTFTKDHAIGALAALGVIFGAAYMLWLYQRVFFGEKGPDYQDINWREAAPVLPLLLIALVLGVYPRPLLDKIQTPEHPAIHSAAVGGEGGHH